MTVPLPDTLPARLYLMACDDRRGRPTFGYRLGLALRGAALADLLLTGHLVDDNGHARPGRHQPPPADPLLAALLREITDSPRPRRWTTWTRRAGRRDVAEVRTALANAGTITVTQHRMLGMVPVHRVRLRDPRAVAELHRAAQVALSPNRPLTQVDVRTAVLVAVAGAAEVGRVVDWRTRWRNRQRLGELAGPAAPCVRAVRREVRRRRAAQTSAAGG